jgi:tetratricopeptide (TPR) repeat protein
LGKGSDPFFSSEEDAMSQLQDPIAQFRKMTNDDPENELGHYRLGQELDKAGKLDEAVKSYRRTLELSPQFSKVYQLLGACLVKLNQRDEAVRVLREGFAVADDRGDNIPRDEMTKLLVELGEPKPVSKKATSGGPAGDGFRCQRPGCTMGSRGRQLPKPPMNDQLGQRIQANICADCWNDWLRSYSIKVINEMHLDLSTERGQQVYDQVMMEFMGFA